MALKGIGGLDSGLGGINSSSKSLGNSLSKLSSGLEINRASDNAAGLAISENLRSEVTAINQVVKNIGSATGLLRSAEGSLSQVGDMLTRGRELALQASNGTLSTSQRQTISREFNQIKKEIDRLSGSAEFNGQPLFNGELSSSSQNPITVQAGTGAGGSNQISINVIEQTDTTTIGISGSSLDTASAAMQAAEALTGAQADISSSRAGIGALENRFGSAARSASTTRENLIAAEQQIRGLDFAKESSNLSQNKVLLEAGIKTLSSSIALREQLIGGLINSKG